MWVNVEDRLPKKFEKVILFDKDGFGAITGRLGSVGWYLEETLDLSSNVTHWMPLPEPPTLENTNAN